MGFLKNRIRAFGFAFSGIRLALMNEVHMKIHAASAAIVCTIAAWAGITRTEWLIITACIASVLCLELINSAIERLCNTVMPEQHINIRYVKDVAAAAVLIACIGSAIAGLLIFYPYLSRFE